MTLEYRFYSLRMATFNAKSRIGKNIQHKNISVQCIKYELSSPRKILLHSIFLQFFLPSHYLRRFSGTITHGHNGWSSRRFNNVCKFEIPHFFTLVISCKCESCR